MSVEQKARELTTPNVGRSSSSPRSESNGGSSIQSSVADQLQGIGGMLQAPEYHHLLNTDLLQTFQQNPFMSMMYGMHNNPYMNHNTAAASVDVLPGVMENPLHYWSILAAAAQMNTAGGSATPNPAAVVRATPPLSLTDEFAPLSAAAMANLMLGGRFDGGPVGGGHPGILPSTTANSTAVALLSNPINAFQAGSGATMLQQSASSYKTSNQTATTPNNNLVERSSGRIGRMGRVHGSTTNNQIAFDGGFSTRYTLNLPKDRNLNEVKVEHDEHGDYLEVQCGTNNARLYVDKLCQGSKGKAILFKGHWYSPNEFQTESGRETAKDWKRSIRHNQKSLKVMMTKRWLVSHNNDCNCPLCQAMSNPLPLPYSTEMTSSSEEPKKRRGSGSSSNANIPTSSSAIMKNWSMASTTSSAVSPSQLSDKSDIENFNGTSLPTTAETSTPLRGSDFSKKNCKGGGSSYDDGDVTNDAVTTMMADYNDGNCASARKRQRLDDYAYEQMAMQEAVASEKHRHQAANNQNAASSSPRHHQHHHQMLQYPTTASEFMSAYGPHHHAMTAAMDASSATALLTSSIAASYPQLEQHMDGLTPDQMKKFQQFLLNNAKLQQHTMGTLVNNSPNRDDANSPTNGVNSPTNGVNSPTNGAMNSPTVEAAYDGRSDEEEEVGKMESVDSTNHHSTTAIKSDKLVKTEPTNHDEPITEKPTTTTSSSIASSPPSGRIPSWEELLHRGGVGSRRSSFPQEKKTRRRKSKTPRRILTKKGREEMIRSAPDLSLVLYGSKTTSHHDDEAPATPSSTHSFPPMNGGGLNRDSLVGHHTMPLPPCVHYDSAVLERVTVKSAEMAKWDCERVCQFLDEVGCSQYRQNFVEHGVTGHSLPFLRLECLEELGVSKMHSHIIMGSIHRFLGSFGIVFNGRHNYPPSSSSSCATSPPRE